MHFSLDFMRLMPCPMQSSVTFMLGRWVTWFLWRVQRSILLLLSLCLTRSAANAMETENVARMKKRIKRKIVTLLECGWCIWVHSYLCLTLPRAGCAMRCMRNDDQNTQMISIKMGYVILFVIKPLQEHPFLCLGSAVIPPFFFMDGFLILICYWIGFRRRHRRCLISNFFFEVLRWFKNVRSLSAAVKGEPFTLSIQIIAVSHESHFVLNNCFLIWKNNN